MWFILEFWGEEWLRYMQRDVVHKHSSRGDVRHKVLLQLLVLGEEVGRQWLGLGVHHVNAIFDLLDLEPQFQNRDLDQ